MFPYLFEGAEPLAPSVPELRTCACPHAPEGEETCLLRPQSRVELLRVAAALQTRQNVRYLLLAPPVPSPAADCPVTWEDLRQWVEPAHRKIGRSVCLYRSAEAFPCGAAACCRADALGRERDEINHLAGLDIRAETLHEALVAAFPNLTPREVEMVQAWAHRGEPGRLHLPITQAALGQAFRLSRRQAARVLNKAKTENPTAFTRMANLRKHRIRRVGNYTVENR